MMPRTPKVEPLVQTGTVVINPELQWDGKTETINGRTIEKPIGWQLDIERFNGLVPIINHRDGNGFIIDSNNTKCDITYSQQVTLPAGTHYVIVTCESHLVITDEHSVRWNVTVETPHGNDTSEDQWVSPVKGVQSFAVKVVTSTTEQTTLRFRYRVKWADVKGEMRLKKLSLSNTSPLGVPVVGDTLTIRVDTPPPPPTLPEPPHPDATTEAIIAWLVADIANKQTLLANLKRLHNKIETR